MFDRLGTSAAFLIAALVIFLIPSTLRAGDGPLMLVSIDVADDPKAGVPYEATIAYQLADGAEISILQTCFLWSGEGPYCFNSRNDKTASTLTVQLKTKNAGEYTLSAFVRYQVGDDKLETNTVETEIDVES